MCKKRPGRRCGEHAGNHLAAAERQVAKNETRIASLTEHLASTAPASATETHVATKLLQAQDRGETLAEKQAAAQLDYDSTNQGQAALATQAAITNLSDEEREQVEARLFDAKVRREWQNRVNRELRQRERKYGHASAQNWFEGEMRQSEARVQELTRELLDRQEETEDDVAKHVPKDKRPGRRVNNAKANRSKRDRLLNSERILQLLVLLDFESYAQSHLTLESIIRNSMRKALTRA